MMVSAGASAAPLLLVCGDDEFAVKQRAREVFAQWSAEIGGMDHEIIDAGAANAGEALRSLGKLREALQTLPFFGSGKVVWFRNCNFLGDERTAGAQAVTASVGDLARELKEFSWQNVRLLISAGKVDRRKLFYKTSEKIGKVELHAGLSADDRDWADKAEAWARGKLRELNREISEEALGELAANVGPNIRLLNNEIEKLVLYGGEEKRIDLADVNAIVTRNKQARAFALADAIGDRDLPRTLRCLDEELWAMKFDSQKNEIGLLYGIIYKMRVLIVLKELLGAGLIKRASDPGRLKAQLDRLPADLLPADRKFNPLAMHPYVLFKALPQTENYTRDELVGAMESLLHCNRKLVSSGLDAALVLQQTLVHIIHRKETKSGRGPQRVMAQ
jgi:DNA polymerase III subunit delta